jgi:hypothetical protein
VNVNINLADGVPIYRQIVSEVKYLVASHLLLPGRSGGRATDPARGSSGGPAWIRTKDQGIHVAEAFPLRVDYLFTLGY